MFCDPTNKEINHNRSGEQESLSHNNNAAVHKIYSVSQQYTQPK